jgi:hypothetical protein
VIANPEKLKSLSRMSREKVLAEHSWNSKGETWKITKCSLASVHSMNGFA